MDRFAVTPVRYEDMHRPLLVSKDNVPKISAKAAAAVAEPTAKKA